VGSDDSGVFDGVEGTAADTGECRLCEQVKESRERQASGKVNVNGKLRGELRGEIQLILKCWTAEGAEGAACRRAESAHGVAAGSWWLGWQGDWIGGGQRFRRIEFLHGRLPVQVLNEW
jgi:hypothetical protein